MLETAENRDWRLRRTIFVHGAALAFIVVICAAGQAFAEFLGPPEDEGYLSVAVNRALEIERTGKEVPWTNPETGRRGVIVIERTFYRGADRPCRDYRRSLGHGREDRQWVRGTGCRIGPGLWSISETPDGPATSPAKSTKSEGRSSKGAPSSTASSLRDKTVIERPRAKPNRLAAEVTPDNGESEQDKTAERADKPMLPKYTLPTKTEL